jgi:hypothetical protein
VTLVVDSRAVQPEPLDGSADAVVDADRRSIAELLGRERDIGL